MAFASASPRTESDSQGPATTDSWFTWAVTVIALLPRLYVALAWAREPVWDGHYYHFGAVRIAAGLGYSEDVIHNGLAIWKPWTHYPVGYSAYLALFYRVLGSHSWVAPVVNALTGCALVAVLHRMTLPWLGRWRARVASGLVALHPGLIAYGAAVMTETLASFLVVLAAFVVTRSRGRLIQLALGGFVFTTAVLVRPSSVLAVPLVLFLLPLPFWRRISGTVVVGACCVLGVLPWTLRNCHRMDGCAFVSTNAGWNLAIGALTDTGRFRTLRAADGCPIVTGQVQQDRCWRDVGIRVIRDNPRHFLYTAPQKLAQTFDHESFVIEYLHEADPSAWPDSLRQDAREFLSASHRLLVALALFCVVAGVRFKQWRSLAFASQCVVWLGLVYLVIAVVQNDEHPYYWLVIALCTLYWLPLPGHPRRTGIVSFGVGFIASTALTHVAFFGEDRYHMVAIPWFCLCVAAAFGRTAAVSKTSAPANLLESSS